MFKNNFVVAVKANGKVLREFDDTVYLPFGTEYSILLKNMFNQNVKVIVKIDGQDALDGKSLIIDAGDSLDLKRFIKNGNLNAGNAFKFIEKTNKIEKHRGNRAEDGLITIEYEFESDWKNQIQGGLSGAVSKCPQGGIARGWTSDGVYNPNSMYEDVFLADNGPQGNVYYSQVVSSVAPQAAKNTAGITAPGSVQEQKFTQAGFFLGDGKRHIITMQLKGLVEGQTEVVKPVTVTRLKRCSMCGTSVKQTAKFCHECGASVEIV